MGTLIHHWVYVPGKDPALSTKKESVRIKPLKSYWPYGRWNRNQGDLVPWVKPEEHSTETHILANPHPTKCLLPWYILSKLLVAMERKGQKHVRQKQQRTASVLPLSSSYLNRETWGKVVTEAWQECHRVVSDPTKSRVISMNIILHNKGVWKKKFRNFEDSVPFLLVINQSVQENTIS